jgi:hypothetical protein
MRLRFGVYTRVSRHVRVGMSVPVYLAQPRYKSRMKPTKPPRGMRTGVRTWHVLAGVLFGVYLLGAWFLVAFLAFAWLLLPLHF